MFCKSNFETAESQRRKVKARESRIIPRKNSLVLCRIFFQPNEKVNRLTKSHVSHTKHTHHYPYNYSANDLKEKYLTLFPSFASRRVRGSKIILRNDKP
jgi:hypothetical protein